MKKILMAGAIGTLLATSLLASQDSKGMSSLYVGSTKANYNGGDSGDAKVYLGSDLMMPLGKRESDFYFGVGFDFVGIDGFSSSSSAYGNYTLGIQAKVGYSLASLIKHNVNLKADFGYGVTRWESSNYWDTQYSASIDTDIYKGWGVGYKYKHVNTGVDSNQVDSYDTNIFFVQIMF